MKRTLSVLSAAFFATAMAMPAFAQAPAAAAEHGSARPRRHGVTGGRRGPRRKHHRRHHHKASAAMSSDYGVTGG